MTDINSYVDRHADRLIDIVRSLVRIPSENRAPYGSEQDCQRYLAGELEKLGYNPVLYTPVDAPGIKEHPLYWPGRDYTNRPNVAAVRRGGGGGKSLVLSGHVDTVPVGSQPWTRDPFGGMVEDGRIYGRGANDMKAGIATNLFVLQALGDLSVRLRGDVIFESVVDEEFGGVNGTLSGRLMGFNADGAIISEPSSLRVCPAQRGGRTAQLFFDAPNTGILGGGLPAAGVVEQLSFFLKAVPDFARLRRDSAATHPLYAHLADPVPVTVTRIVTAPWGTGEPTNTPSECRVEVFFQAMPGEDLKDIDEQFFNWLETLPWKPRVEFPIRWLPGSAMPQDAPFVRDFTSTAEAMLGRKPLVQGIEGPCDMYIFHEFGIPAVLWGGSGGNTHNPDEYVEIQSLVDAAKVLLSFVCEWCGEEQK